jgi:hypothetical protein
MKLKKKQTVEFFRGNPLSASSIALYLQCFRQFEVAKIEGYRPREKGFSAKDFGKLWHWLHAEEHHHRHFGKGRGEFRIADAVRWWQEQFLSLRPEMTEVDHKNLDLAVAQILALWPTYHSFWGPRFEGNPEVHWQFTHSVRVSPAVELEVHLTGFFDWYQGGKSTFFIERKTSSRIVPHAIEDRLLHDLQVGLYFYALRRKEPDVKVYQGCLDVVRHPSTHKRVAESYTQYRSRLANEVIAKNADHYFHRFSMQRAGARIDRWVASTLDPILKEMYLRVTGQIPRYVNPMAIETRYGTSAYAGAVLSKDYGNLTKKRVEDIPLRDVPF